MYRASIWKHSARNVLQIDAAARGGTNPYSAELISEVISRHSLRA